MKLKRQKTGNNSSGFFILLNLNIKDQKPFHITMLYSIYCRKLNLPPVDGKNLG
jgi:hypothetical protein